MCIGLLDGGGDGVGRSGVARVPVPFPGGGVGLREEGTKKFNLYHNIHNTWCFFLSRVPNCSSFIELSNDMLTLAIAYIITLLQVQTVG